MTSSFSSCKKGIRAGRCKESRIHHTGNLKLTPVFQNPAKLTFSKIHVHKKSCMHLSAVPNLQVLHLLVLTHTHTQITYSTFLADSLPAHTELLSHSPRDAAGSSSEEDVSLRLTLPTCSLLNKAASDHRLSYHYMTPCCCNGTLSPSATVKIVRAETFLLSVQNTYADRRPLSFRGLY